MSNENNSMVGKILYRYEDPYNYDDIKIRLNEYEIIKETPCGYWIKKKSMYGHKKWMAKKTKHPYAFFSKEEALDSYIARKRSQLCIVEGQKRNAEYFLSIALEKD